MSPSVPSAVRFRELRFAYESGDAVFPAFSLDIPARSRTLLIGANGVGKSTLLRLIAGRHLVPAHAIEVFGHAPFYGVSTASEIALIDSDFPIDIDIRVSELLAHRPDFVDTARENELVELLGVDPGWRMTKISEGQRRRVQLLLSLRKNVKLLLLDEITAHLDVLMRADLLAWLRSQNEKHGLAVIYTTHILDGLWMSARSAWPTHLMTMTFTAPPQIREVESISELKRAAAKAGESFSPLLSYCEKLIRDDLRLKGSSSRPGSR